MTIHKETVSDLLWESLEKLMSLAYLSDFRLVGETSTQYKTLVVQSEK